MEQKEIDERNELLRNHMLSLAKEENWRHSLAMTNDSFRLFENEAWLSEINTVYIVGHGTSLATALNAESFFAHIAKVNARALPAFQFSRYVDDYLIDPQKTLVVGISCGGNTASVVQSVEIANNRGAITVCLSGSEDMTLAKVAHHRIITDAHKEKVIEVMAYSISHIFLLLGAYQLAVLIGSKNGSLNDDQVDYWHGQLDQVISAAKCLPDLFEQMDEISKAMRNTCGQNFVVLGTGPNVGTMKEGALKISEFSWMFGAGEELEDFAHGRFREVNSRIPLLIISPTGKTYEKTLDILTGCSISKTPSIVFTDEKTSVLKKLATFVVELPKLQDEYITPFLYVFPLWFYGYHIRRGTRELVGEKRHNILATDLNFKAKFDPSGEKLV